MSRTRHRLWIAAALAAGLMSGSTVVTAASPGIPAAARSDGGTATSYGVTMNILPPGSSGNVDAEQFAALVAGNAGNPTGILSDLANVSTSIRTATPTSPPNFADQWEKYAALDNGPPSSLTNASLTNYFKDAPLGVAASDVVRTETPRPGVTIKWDRDGVPHIYGKTHPDIGYGAGIADMEDRMFLTDVLRHTGEGKMAEFVGPTDADIAQDAAQLQVAPYTAKQINRQINAVAEQDPKEGKPLLATLHAYVAGLNYEQKQLCPYSSEVTLPGDLGSGFGQHCPVEYAAIGRPPQPYTISDIVSIASLIGGVFGTGGGGQYTNAIWLEQLEHRFGKAKAEQIYNDLREKNDPEAPTTSPVRDRYEDGPIDPNKPGVAMPDLHPKATALGTGAIVNSDGSLSPPPSGAAGNQGNASTTPPKPTPKSTTATTYARLGVNPAIEAQQIDGELARGLEGQMTGMSNALLVSAKYGQGHHPVAVFGPQTGYYTPQLLMEEDLEGPGVKARGVSFAGTNFVLELGHGVDYAWSATSPYTDITDTVVQRLCVPHHPQKRPAITATHYINESGKCVAMFVGYDKETGLPSLAAQTGPKSLKLLVLRTDDGIVELRTTVHGRPVAIVTERSTYGHDVDSVLGFYRLDNPRHVHGPHGFLRSVSAIKFTFNWYYVDNRNIAYFSSSYLPRRAPGTDLDLPRWGSRRFAWRGFEPVSKHPQVVNPKQGYIVNWNNKLAPEFSSSSEDWGDGSVYRSLTLQERVRDLIRSGQPVTRARLVGAMIGAATVDVPGRYDLPWVLRVIGRKSTGNAADDEAIRLLRSWAAAGAHRKLAPGSSRYTHQQAIDLFDTWWDPADSPAGCPKSGCRFSLPQDALRGRLHDYVSVLPEPLEDPPTEHIGSAYNGISWYGYVNKDLRTLLGKRVTGRYSHIYCGNGSLAHCRAALISSLTKAVRDATGTSSPTAADVLGLTYDPTRDDIDSYTAGVTAVHNIPWQNRPTFQQVVQFTGHRS